jgi:hypothetical protein
MAYPATGQLTEYELGFLNSAQQRALASGFQAAQQANSHPDGSKIMLKIYMNEQLQRQVPQQHVPQMAGVPATTMVNTGTYGAPQQFGQQIPQQGAYAGQAPVTVQTYGAQPQMLAQGQAIPGYQVQGAQGQVYQAQPPQGQHVQGQTIHGQVYQGQVIQQGQVVQQQIPQQGVAMAALLQGQPAAATLQSGDRQPVYTAPASRRRALVIGVDGYLNLESLQKARNDAQAVSNALVDLGFDVLTLYDASRREINSAVSTLAGQIEPGDEVLFYFAGHGIEVDGRNYLLPSDVPVVNYGDESFLTGESIPAGRILDTFQRKGARTTVMVLDACRNNPFSVDGKRSVGGSRGLVRMEPPEGAFILYSAGAGQTALDRLSDDDQNPNSVFTRALLPRLQEQGMSLHDLAKQVRRDVQQLAASVNHEQFPAYYDQMSGDMFLSASQTPNQ